MFEDIYMSVIEGRGLTKEDLMVRHKISRSAEEKGIDIDEYRELSDLISDASFFGHKDGFILGFKTAVNLMANCIDERKI